MDTDILNELRNQIYEAEGLVELLGLRPEKEAHLLPLIQTKLELALSLVQFPENQKSLEPETEPEPEPGPKPEKVTQPQEEPVAVTIPDPLYRSVAEPMSIPAADSKTDEARKPKFCLNDRFRFRRALFGGDNDAFDRAVAKISALPSYEEAEEYFFGTLALDPTDEDVMDFMEVLKTFYGE